MERPEWFYEWLGFKPKNEKNRRMKKWMRQMKDQLKRCDHDWRHRNKRNPGDESFDLVCCRCRGISYTVEAT